MSDSFKQCRGPVQLVGGKQPWWLPKQIQQIVLTRRAGSRGHHSHRGEVSLRQPLRTSASPAEGRGLGIEQEGTWAQCIIHPVPGCTRHFLLLGQKWPTGLISIGQAMEYLVLRLLQVPTCPEGKAKAMADFGFIFSASQLLCQPQSWKAVIVRKGWREKWLWPPGGTFLLPQLPEGMSAQVGHMPPWCLWHADSGAGCQQWDVSCSIAKQRLLTLESTPAWEVPKQDRHLHRPRHNPGEVKVQSQDTLYASTRKFDF